MLSGFAWIILTELYRVRGHLTSAFIDMTFRRLLVTLGSGFTKGFSVECFEYHRDTELVTRRKYLSRMSRSHEWAPELEATNLGIWIAK